MTKRDCTDISGCLCHRCKNDIPGCCLSNCKIVCPDIAKILGEAQICPRFEEVRNEKA